MTHVLQTTARQLSGWPSGLRRQFAKRGIAGSIPDRDTYFNFKFLLPSHSSQLGKVNPNKIEHGMYVILDPSYD